MWHGILQGSGRQFRVIVGVTSSILGSKLAYDPSECAPARRSGGGQAQAPNIQPARTTFGMTPGDPDKHMEDRLFLAQDSPRPLCSRLMGRWPVHKKMQNAHALRWLAIPASGLLHLQPTQLAGFRLLGQHVPPLVAVVVVHCVPPAAAAVAHDDTLVPRLAIIATPLH